MVKPIVSAALFSGIGGFCKGLDTCGIKTIWAVEKNAYAVATYEKNYPSGIVVKYEPGHPNSGLSKDIRDVSVVGDALAPVDILTAGFPCQSFSQAGDRKGFNDVRGQLFFEIPRLLREFGDQRPKILILENVPYLRIGNGGSWFAQIKSEIQAAGYWFSENNAQILDPLELGILPQRRERLFMVAAATNVFRSNKFEFPSGLGAPLLNVDQYISIKKRVDNRYYLARDNRYFAELDKILSTKKKGALVQYRKYYARDIAEGICPTLTANMGQGGHNVPFLKDSWGIRKLTEAECARLQGFKNIFFPKEVPSTWRYTQIGNSVSVPIAELLGRQALEKIGNLNG